MFGKKNQILVFPDTDGLDPDELWSNLIETFVRATKNGENTIIAQCLDKFRLLLFNQIFPLTTDRLSVAVVPLFEYITTFPFQNSKLQKDSCLIFSKFISFPEKLPKDEKKIRLSLEQTLGFYNYLYNVKPRLFKPNASENRAFLTFFNSISLFFDEEDADRLIYLYYDQIGFDSEKSLFSLTMICRFMPPKYYYKISDDFFGFLENPICSQISELVFFFLNRASYYVECKDYDRFWHPHIDTIFHSILCSMDPNIKIVGVRTGMDSKTCSFLMAGYDDYFSITSSGSCLLASILPGNYEVLGKLETLLNLMTPLLTPKSKKGSIFSSFVMNLIDYFHYRVDHLNLLQRPNEESINAEYNVNSNENENNKYFVDKDVKCDQIFFDDFVRVLVPYLKNAFFFSVVIISSAMIKAIPKLCEISYEVMKEEFLQMAIDKMVDAENSNTSNRCLRIVYKLVPSLLRKDHIQDSLQFLPTIVENAFSVMGSSAHNFSLYGTCIICTISLYMYFPYDFNYMNLREKNAVISMSSRIVEFISNFLRQSEVISGVKPTIVYDKFQPFMKFIAYFASFEDEIFLNHNSCSNFTRIFESLNPDYQPRSVFNLMRVLTMAKGSIVIDFFIPKFLNILLKNKESFFSLHSRLKYYVNAICGVIYTDQAILKYLDTIIEELIFVQLKSLDAKKIKLVTYLLFDTILCICSTVNKDWTCSEVDENDVRKMWGKQYERISCVPKWFRFDEKVKIFYSQKLINFLIPFVKENYAKGESKVQERLMACIDYTLNFFVNLGQINSPINIRTIYKSDNDINEEGNTNILNEKKPNIAEYTGKKENVENIGDSILDECIGNLDFSDMEKRYGQIENENEENILLNNSLYDLQEELLEMIAFLITSKEINTCQRSLTPIFSFIRLIITTNSVYFSDFNRCTSTLGLKMKQPSKYVRFLTLAHRYSVYQLFKQDYTLKINVPIKRLLDHIKPFRYSQFRSIFQDAICFISFFSVYCQEEYFMLMDNSLKILESGIYNEDQFRGCLLFIKAGLLKSFFKNQLFLIRYLKTLVTIKFEKKWNISKNLNWALSDLDGSNSISAAIKDTQEWTDFMNELPKLNRTIDMTNFLKIIQFCVNQKPPISPGLFEYLLNSVVKNETDLNKYFSLNLISTILTKLKPISPKIISEEEPKYIDNVATGFFCKPKFYRAYSGTSKFVCNSTIDEVECENENDQTIIIQNNPLLNCFFNAVNSTFIFKLISACEMIHPDKHTPFLNITVFVWKGLTQLLKTKIISFLLTTENNSIDMIKGNTMNNENILNNVNDIGEDECILNYENSMNNQKAANNEVISNFKCFLNNESLLHTSSILNIENTPTNENGSNNENDSSNNEYNFNDENESSNEENNINDETSSLNSESILSISSILKKDSILVNGNESQISNDEIIVVNDNQTNLGNVNKSDNILIEMLRSTKVPFITACEIISGIFLGIKHWTDDQITFCEEKLLIPFFTEMFNHKTVESTMNIFDTISENRDPNRFKWLLSVIEKLLKKKSGLEFGQVMRSVSYLYNKFSIRYDSVFSKMMKELIFPKFSSDFSNSLQLNLIELGMLVRSRDSAAVSRNYKDYQFLFYRDFFLDVIDPELDKNCDKIMSLLCYCLVPWKYGCYRVFEFVYNRLIRFFDVYSKLSTKYEIEGKLVLLIAGGFQWHLYPQKLDIILYDLVYKILPNKNWRTKEVIIGFLHLMCFIHIYQFPKIMNKYIFSEVLPFFLIDDNDDVVKNAICFLKMLVNIIYMDNIDNFANLILYEFDPNKYEYKDEMTVLYCGNKNNQNNMNENENNMNENENNMNENENNIENDHIRYENGNITNAINFNIEKDRDAFYESFDNNKKIKFDCSSNHEKMRRIAISHSCGLLANVTVWSKCPPYLPKIFMELERVQKDNPLHSSVHEAIQEFWKRHQYMEIPEIEEFRDALRNDYFA